MSKRSESTPLRRLAPLLALLTWSPATAAGPPSGPGGIDAPPGDGDSIEAVLLFEDGRSLDLGPVPWEVDDELLARAWHAWIWSGVSAPKRIEARDLATFAVLPAERSVVLTVPGLRPSEARTLGVVAAPAAMWAEIPEASLPRFGLDPEGVARLPVDAGAPWRLRLLGDHRGSTWIDLPAGSDAASAFSEAAEPLVLEAVTAAGDPAPGVAVSVLAAPAAGGGGVVALYHGDDQGRVVLPALPPSRPVRLILNQPDHAPATLAGPPGRLAGRIVLAAGDRFQGRVLRASGEDVPPVAVAGARVRVETWLGDDGDALFRKTATTGEDGRWQIPAVPAHPAMVEVQAPGLVPWSRRLEPDAEGAAARGASGRDLGDVVLRPGVSLDVAVTDDLGRPVAGARVEAGPPAPGPRDGGGPARVTAEGATGGDGGVRLEALAAGDPLVVRVAAAGHVDTVELLRSPLPERTVLRLTRAHRVSGRLTDAEGVPVLEGSVRVQHGGAFRDEPLEPGGAFDLALAPATSAELILTSPRSVAVRVAVPAGAAGEALDLGEIRAPGGLTVAGTLRDRLDGSPVAGARIWVPRRMEGGPLVAWMLGQVIEAASDAEGRFELAGLDLAPDLIRIDAPGRARLHLPVRPEPDNHWLDAGDLWVEAGAAVRFALPGEGGGERASARADLRNRGLEIDMLTASVHGRVAVLEPLPPRQEVTLSVVRGGTVHCEQRVVAPDSGETLDLDCADAGIEVSGTLLAGGEAVSGGTLLWTTPPAQEGAVILTQVSTSGLRRQSTAGAGRPPVQVELDGEGRFVTHDLVAGSWRVSWSPSGGGSAQELSVEIPALESYAVTLELPGRTVQGRVLDPEGRPVSRARVRDLGRGTTALTSQDGSFVLTGLETATVELEARWRDLRSPPAAVEAGAGRSPTWVDLYLQDDPDDELLVQVLGAAGDPKGGAFVLLEDELRNLRLLTADRDGRAKVRMQPPAPSRFRLAALADGVWAFGAWSDWDPRRAERVIEVGGTGTALIATEGAAASPAIEGPLGWDVSALLSRVGLRPFVSAEEPLHLAGLPAGSYRIGIGETARTIAVERGEVATVELP